MASSAHGDAGAGVMLLTAFGATAAATMVVAYALEDRATAWVAVFAGGCACVSVYGILTGAWIFAVLEMVWAAIAIQRFRGLRAP